LGCTLSHRRDIEKQTLEGVCHSLQVSPYSIDQYKKGEVKLYLSTTLLILEVFR
jgi:hypothetical protein